MARKRSVNNMLEHERAVMHVVMFQSGLVPIEATHHDVARSLSLMSKEEQRVLKRRFRKMWRKLARIEAGKTGIKDANIWLKNRYGGGKVNPSKSDRVARKELVQKYFYEDVVTPIIDNFEQKRGDQGPTKP